MSGHLTLTPDELLTTTRAVIEECLTIAQEAPTGSNLQNWHFVVVTAAGTRRGLADVYSKGWALYTTLPIASGTLTFDDP